MDKWKMRSIKVRREKEQFSLPRLFTRFVNFKGKKMGGTVVVGARISS